MQSAIGRPGAIGPASSIYTIQVVDGIAIGRFINKSPAAPYPYRTRGGISTIHIYTEYTEAVLTSGIT